MDEPSASNTGISPAATDYWTESRRPLASLAFVAPLLVVYEVGVVALGPQAIRNGADVWLRQMLVHLDFGHYFLLPVLTVCILLGWHYTTREPWRVSRSVLSGMVAESAFLAVCLRLILQAEAVLLGGMGNWLSSLSVTAPRLSMSRSVGGVVGYLGAGVYEELLFRLILLSLSAWVIRQVGVEQKTSAVAAVFLTSLCFSLAHYVGPYGDPVQLHVYAFWFGFVFRFLAGMFFSILFVCRGFGIAVGAHAGYDLLVQVW